MTRLGLFEENHSNLHSIHKLYKTDTLLRKCNFLYPRKAVGFLEPVDDLCAQAVVPTKSRLQGANRSGATARICLATADGGFVGTTRTHTENSELRTPRVVPYFCCTENPVVQAILIPPPPLTAAPAKPWDLQPLQYAPAHQEFLLRASSWIQYY